MNQVNLFGVVTKDPDFKMTQSGVAVCNISLATTKNVKQKDGSFKEISEYHKVVAWGKQAELCQKFLQEGSKLLVQGEIRTESYEKDGKKQYITKIQADRVFFTGESQKFRTRQRQDDYPPF